MDHTDRNLSFLLHDVARLMRKRFEQNARDLGLTRSQCAVLAHLSRNEGIQQSALADLLEVEPITLTRLLDRLEALGLVARGLHPTDRRIRLLRLTDAARPKIAEISNIAALTRGESLDGVPEAVRDQLVDVLATMKANLLGKLPPMPREQAGERSSDNG